jgi:subtilisin family serine protease
VLPQLDFTGDRQKGDPQGHGTHVAGTAAGAALDCGDGPSAIGVAPHARILPIRVLDAEGSGRVSDVVSGIRAAADDPRVTVINLSLGGDLSFLDGGGDDFREAISYAWSKGKIPVLAAGNSGLLGGVFGSGYGGLDAVVVTATTNQDRKAGYASSVGSAKWGIAAPGGDGSGRPGADVLSAYPGNKCAVLGGTSMAAPHVSGALAVLRSRGLGQQAAVDRILETATPIGDRSTYGAGLVNLRVAIEVLDTATPATNPGRGTTTSTTSRVTPAPSSGATATPVPTSAPTAGGIDEGPTAESPAPDVQITEPELRPRVTVGADVDPDEIAAGGRARGGSGDSPSAPLVAAAVAACGGVAVAGWRLRRLL